MGVSGVGDRVTGRRGELVGAQGVLSAKWLVRNNGSFLGYSHFYLIKMDS